MPIGLASIFKISSGQLRDEMITDVTNIHNLENIRKTNIRLIEFYTKVQWDTCSQGFSDITAYTVHQ